MKGAAGRLGETRKRLRDPGRAFSASSVDAPHGAPLPSVPPPAKGTRRPFGVSVSHLYRHLVRSVVRSLRLTHSGRQPNRARRGPVCRASSIVPFIDGRGKRGLANLPSLGVGEIISSIICGSTTGVKIAERVFEMEREYLVCRHFPPLR